MATNITHWTERSIEDFAFSIAADFVRQIEQAMDGRDLSQADLAKRLGVSTGRVSQVMNNPGNLTLKNIVQYARALGLKTTVVTYDDEDPANQKGPVAPEVFSTCWDRCGNPTDFFALENLKPPQFTTVSFVWVQVSLVQMSTEGSYFTVKNTMAVNSPNITQTVGAIAFTSLKVQGDVSTSNNPVALKIADIGGYSDARIINDYVHT